MAALYHLVEIEEAELWLARMDQGTVRSMIGKSCYDNTILKVWDQGLLFQYKINEIQMSGNMLEFVSRWVNESVFQSVTHLSVFKGYPKINATPQYI